MCLCLHFIIQVLSALINIHDEWKKDSYSSQICVMLVGAEYQEATSDKMQCYWIS